MKNIIKILVFIVFLTGSVTSNAQSFTDQIKAALQGMQGTQNQNVAQDQDPTINPETGSRRYEGSALEVNVTGVQPYTMQEVVDRIVSIGTIDEEATGVRMQDAGFISLLNNVPVPTSDESNFGWNFDPPGVAFDRATFGPCQRFYIFSSRFVDGDPDPPVNTSGATGTDIVYMYLIAEFKDNSFKKIQPVFDWIVKNDDSVGCSTAAKKLASDNFSDFIKILSASGKIKHQQQIENLKARTACFASGDRKLAHASTEIFNAQTDLSNSKARLAQENDAAKISGFVDKQLMYNLGKTILTDTQWLNTNFPVYKKMGGTAKTPLDVTALPDPCAKYSDRWGQIL